MNKIALILLPLAMTSCASFHQLTRDEANDVINRVDAEPNNVPPFNLSLDEYAQVIMIDGKPSNRAGVCTRFVGNIDVTIYLARIKDSADLERVYRHELEHVKSDCHEGYHDEHKSYAPVPGFDGTSSLNDDANSNGTVTIKRIKGKNF